MAELSRLESLESLYLDLHALSESRLSNVDRLEAQLNAHIEDFKKLLDKKPRNEESRKTLATGKLNVSGDQYTINEEFQQLALKLADDLNLDELDAARIFLEAQDGMDSAGRSTLTNSIIRFHQRRKYLLDCLCILFRISADVDGPEDLRNYVHSILDQFIRPPQNGPPSYIQRCFTSMNDIKVWLQGLAERLNGASVLNQVQQPEVLETIEYQRVSLVKQHESLSIIAFYLAKDNFSSVDDFKGILGTLKKADKYDNLLLHYFPVLGACISRYGGIDGGIIADARALNTTIFELGDHNSWTLSYVHAAFRAWWLSEYSGWYGEYHDGSFPENQLEEGQDHDRPIQSYQTCGLIFLLFLELRQRSKQFTEALKDGAFDFILSMAADVKSIDWHDPARHGLRQWLQRKSPVILADSIPFSELFQELLVEQLSTFVESFITFLPDVLRKLRVDEDEQRQLSKEHEHDLDLEKFITIISYVFEGRPKAAQQDFWDNRDGALMGFVEWSSKRASTPLMSTFCEMLQSIAEDEECATEAHKFLLDEGGQSSSKLRRAHSLTWNQMFKELTYFSAKIRDRPAMPQSQTFHPGKPSNDLAEKEPESAMMLESYLRLITRLCSESEEARTFLAQHPSFHISELLFQLASSSIQPRLRACAFTTLRSLLSHKSKEAGEYMWAGLDVWISGGYAPGSYMPKSSATSSNSPGGSMTGILRALGSGFEEPNAFVELLTALVMPYSDESALRDGLPFPETLGISHRQPGIDPYVDFAVGQIFGGQTQQLNEIIHVRLLQLTCLNFIATCLDTFNEDLVIFASQSNIVVDHAIKTSSLQSYVLLHPFSRVMEWVFNEKVMGALFATIHQDPAEVARSAPDSPLVLCLLRGLHVVTKILDLQPTYLDIIKPVVRSQQNYRRVPVPNASFGSFEDGVLNHLLIIPDLGRYCGTGHAELVVASLKLLEMLSSSPKLASPANTVLGRGSDRNKALAALDEDAETISQILLREVESHIDDNIGPDSSTYAIKIHILDFLISCLRAAPNQPTIAHLLLGFQCGNGVLSLDSDAPISRGVSLFYAIVDQALNSPLEDEAGISSWLVSLNKKSFEVIKELWISPISSNLTMTNMRANNSFFWMFLKEVLIQSGMAWDGINISEPSNLNISPAISCLSDFLSRRALKFQYLSAELRQVSHSHAPSLKQRMFETLSGSTTLDDGQKLDNPSIFDFFDFMEPEFASQMESPQLSWFSDVDLSACLDDQSDPSSTYNISRVQELLLLRRSELTFAKRLEDPQNVALVETQSREVLEFYSQYNQLKNIGAARLHVLRAWVQLTLVMIENGDLDSSAKTSFVIKALQTIMPRLESDMESVPEAIELARLAKALIFCLDFKSDSFRQGDLGDAVNDRLFHLFRVSLKAINTLGAKVSLKEIYYNISYRYLCGMSDVAGISSLHRRHSVQTIKSAGDRFIDTVCDDAHSGEPTCRIAALLVLGALVKMGHAENSKYIIESLTRLNFIGILVDSVSSMSVDLRSTQIEDTDIQLSYCHSKLALLLQLSQTRFGAAAVLNSGLFHSIKESELFATDPDLGVDIVGPGALEKHYNLLAAAMRVICAAVLSRGPQNQQTIDQGRRFLSENRLSVLAVLKKSAGLGSSTGVSEQIIDELAESFLLLISMTGFLDFEDQNVQQKQAPRVFTAFT